jgi:hypothetical protein
MSRVCSDSSMPLSVALSHFRQSDLAKTLGITQGRLSQIKKSNPDAIIRISDTAELELVVTSVLGRRSVKKKAAAV